ncbi:FKBP-type peptidyl-prolyl cis-trans isomerase [Microbacterium sp. DT81.1]|uniref:FKBP-type peptidyl-prolyl cis-trans isomerase n=1 Tax=Microbacterium sp. DT81.1 TaxID=3393413 RepID=UPI003CE95568
MRRIPAVLAVSALAALTLAGCSSSGSASPDGCTRPASDGAAADLVTVSGDTDSAPEVDAYTPLKAKSTTFADIETGTGAAITEDGQLVVLDLTIVNGTDGETLFQTAYDGSNAQVVPLSDWTGAVPGLGDALECATEGSRVVAVIAPDDIDAGAASTIGLAEGDSAVAVVDVRKVYLPKADGRDQFVEGRGLPTVVRAADGTPGIMIPDAAPPDEVVVQVLKKGDGEVVTGDDPVRVHYTGVTWAEKEVFDSSWGKEPVSLTVEGVVEGFGQALEGQTVGSQILVVIPPEAGYGDQAQGSIPANSTLVFVIDILGIDAAPAQ